jgi:hypothetical protein
MSWLDPEECAAARDCLEHGNVLEAAQKLLGTPNREHRAVQKLLLEISGRLVDQAREANARGDVVVAWEAIDRAAQCAALQDEALALWKQLSQGQEEADKAQAWREQRVADAQALANEGRLRTALGRIVPLTDKPDVRRLKTDIEERQARFERYIAESRDHLDRGELGMAERSLKLAQEIKPNDSEVIRLAEALREAARPVAVVAMTTTTSEEPTAPTAQPINSRWMGFSIGFETLVLLAQEVVIGTPRGEAVHLPMLGPLHGRHAMISRDRGQYQLLPLTDRHGQLCDVRVGGATLAASRLLCDGDMLEFGGPHCAWVFRLPVAGSTTAVLEQTKPSSTSIHTPDGSEFRRVVLADEALEFRSQVPAHCVLSDLPCERLAFRWNGAGLVAESEDGELTIEPTGPAGDSHSVPLSVPSRLTIHVEMSEAEILGRTLVSGDEPVDTLHLSLRDPYQPSKLRLEIETEHGT